MTCFDRCIALVPLVPCFACSADGGDGDTAGATGTTSSDTTAADGSTSTTAAGSESGVTSSSEGSGSDGDSGSTSEGSGSTGEAACGEAQALRAWPSSGFVAAFTAAGEHAHVWIDNEAANAYVVSWLIEPDVPFGIPGGPIELDGTYNPGYSYRLDPTQVSIADLWTEVCDAAPCYIEADAEGWAANPGDWCPWGFTLETLYDCRDGDGQACAVAWP